MNVNGNQSKIIWNKEGAGFKEKQEYLIEFKGSKGVKPHEGLGDHRQARSEAHRLCLQGCMFAS